MARNQATSAPDPGQYHQIVAAKKLPLIRGKSRIALAHIWHS